MTIFAVSFQAVYRDNNDNRISGIFHLAHLVEAKTLTDAVSSARKMIDNGIFGGVIERWSDILEDSYPSHTIHVNSQSHGYHFEADVYSEIGYHKENIATQKEDNKE